MQVLNKTELTAVSGGIDDYVPPSRPPGVSQWEWDQLIRLLEEQKRRDRQQQN